MLKVLRPYHVLLVDVRSKMEIFQTLLAVVGVGITITLAVVLIFGNIDL
jgi:hypothetical protein